jgi:hypothetical protein
MRRQASATTARRRRQSQVLRERTSLVIRADVLEAAKEIVTAGRAENLSAFVEAAVEEKVRRTRREDLYSAYAEAAADESFRESMTLVSRQFEPSESDGL